jgi:type IV pilus assembly protein PilF
MKAFRAVLALSVAALLAGCATSQVNSRVSDEDAARFNVQLGMNYMQRGDLEEARNRLERAVQQDASLPSAHAALGILYERVGDSRRAGDHLRRALRLAPEDPSMQNSYGGFLCRQGERLEGIRHFEAAANNAYFRRPEVAYTNAGVCARGIPDEKLAEAYFRRALDADRNFNEALLQLADLSLQTDRSLQARAFIQRYHGVAAPTPYSLMLARNIELAAGDTRSASEYAARLRREFPESPEAREIGRE